MKTLELFCGTKSFSKVMVAHGHHSFTLDIDVRFDPTVAADVRHWEPQPEAYDVDILWASPPCQGFSVAAIGKNWFHDGSPKTDSARSAMAIAKRTLELIDILKPKWWFIENPRGMLRKMSWLETFVLNQRGVQRTVTYCQYGDTRMKPTDIWTNAVWWTPKPPCKNGASCHVSAPRGARTGTQGIAGAIERGVIPPALFDQILLQYAQASSE